MKDIKLPVETDSSIDLSSINACTEGIILAYKSNKCVGYINYDDNYWYYTTSIDAQDSNMNSGTLYDLILDLTSAKYVDNFKLLEFAYD